MFYERVLSYCEDEGISVDQFEKECGLGHGAVGKWKNDRITPSVRTLSKISKYTGISIGHWLGGVL